MYLHPYNEIHYNIDFIKPLMHYSAKKSSLASPVTIRA
jgi:hypothetical protein